MKKCHVSMVMLALLALPLYGAATPETASPPPAAAAVEAAERAKWLDTSIQSLSGIFTIRTLQGERYPALIDSSGRLVRLEGDIARQLAYGSEGHQVSLEGYLFPDRSNPPRYVVTRLERSARKEERDEKR